MRCEVFIGSVEAFPSAKPDKAQALKPLEEASEVHAAWQAWDRAESDDDDCERLRAKVLDEIADTVQACANLAHAMGCDDLAPYMQWCRLRNEERGRYTEVAE